MSNTIYQQKTTTSTIEQAYLEVNPEGKNTVLFIHGNASSSIFWKRLMQRLPEDTRGIAPDLRGFGNTEDVLIDATKGMREFSTDIIALLDQLDINKVHVVGHSMGGSVCYALAGDHPNRLASIILVNPGSPYGFGGTKDLEGNPHFSDFAGSGAGVVNPDFAKRIEQGDRTEEDPNASPRVVMNNFYWKPPFRPENEEELLDGLLSEKVGPQKYPGDSVPSENFPFTAPGKFGPPNALSPKYISDTVDKFIEKTTAIPVLWIRGEEDQIVSDKSLFDLGTLGAMGLIPGFPGEDIYPPQPMVSQTRQVLEKRQNNGGEFKEIIIKDAGHSPYIEKEDEFCSYFMPFIKS